MCIVVSEDSVIKILSFGLEPKNIIDIFKWKCCLPSHAHDYVLHRLCHICYGQSVRPVMSRDSESFGFKELKTTIDTSLNENLAHCCSGKKEKKVKSYYGAVSVV